METNRTAPDPGATPDADGGPGPDAAPSPGPGPYAGATPNTGAATGFFAWLRRLGVPRRAGWLGGVCAGVGARIGVDPIVVRGIVVVLAVLGAPFVLVYALAWLLLPDTDGEIHFERLLRGTVDPAVIGVLVLGVVGLVPLVQGGWLGWRWWPELPIFTVPWLGLDLGWIIRGLFVLALIAGVIWLVVWLAIRSGASASNPSVPTPNAPNPTAPMSHEPYAAAAAPAAATAATAATAAPLAPEMPAPGASTEELSDWRMRQEAWRQSYAAWKAGQAEAARVARAQAAEENKARARELTAQADAARAARRASRPRASAAFVFAVLGLALVGGAIAAIVALTGGVPDTAGFAVPIAVAVGALVLAAGMIVAALRRRRSGALAFFTATTVVAMLVATGIAAVLPEGRLIGPGYSIPLTVSDRVVQPVGDAFLGVYTVVDDHEALPRIELTQGLGSAYLSLEENDRVKFVSSDTGPITIWTYDRDGNATASTIPALNPSDAIVIGGANGLAVDDEPIDAIVVLQQGTGQVSIDITPGAGR